MCRFLAFGSFDVFPVGHLNIFEQAKQLGDYLAVGVSSDNLKLEKMSGRPVYDHAQRIKIVGSLRFVDRVFIEESLKLKRQYILAEKADILVMGDDWVGKFNDLSDICKVIYLERTPSVSTTEIIEVVKNIPSPPSGRDDSG